MRRHLVDYAARAALVLLLAAVAWILWPAGSAPVEAEPHPSCPSRPSWISHPSHPSCPSCTSFTSPPVNARVNATPRAISCRYECICFRTNGYRCLRTYTEPCDGKECWQCQDRVTLKARQSCSIGVPIRSCFCKPYRQ